MIGLSRPFGPLLACGGALGVAVAGTFAVGITRGATVVEMPAVVVTALRPLPSPDSLAALLVSSPRGSRSSRATRSVLLDAIAMIDGVPSSTERAELLAEIVDLPELDSEVVSAVGESAGRISSPSARSRVLRALIRNHPDATGDARRPVLEAIGTMQSTPERAVTLEMFVTSYRLSQPALIDALSQVERLRADNERSRVLVAAAGAQRIEGRARSTYLRVASGIPSDRYRMRALDALSHRRGRRDGR
jgi:hypothetical protein